jgi:uncharacterized protein (TIGR02145 family)
MAKDMNVGTKINSTQSGFQQLDNDTIEKYCYNNDEAYCVIYGGLYEWQEVMQYVITERAQGICPVGWHIPTDGEYTALADYLGGESVAGGKMKTTGTIEAGTGLWYAPNTGATNDSGFTGLPGGYRSDNGSFYSLGYCDLFWTSSQSRSDGATLWSLGCYDDLLYRFYGSGNYGNSLRCLKDTD